MFRITASFTASRRRSPPAPAPFSLTFSRNQHRVVVAVHGELDCSTGPTLHERLADLIEFQGNLSVVVDLTSTTFIDSSGIEVLVTAHRWLRKRGGRLHLAVPRGSVLKVFEITGLDRVLTIGVT